jgi:hypothetical protein
MPQATTRKKTVPPNPRRLAAAKASLVISSLQIALYVVLIIAYVKTRSEVSPHLTRTDDALYDATFAFVVLSLPNILLLAWEGLIACRTKQVDKKVWGLGIVVVLLFVSILVLFRSYPGFINLQD